MGPLYPQTADRTLSAFAELEDLTAHGRSRKIQVVPHSLVLLCRRGLYYITRRMSGLTAKISDRRPLCQLSERLTELQIQRFHYEQIAKETCSLGSRAVPTTHLKNFFRCIAWIRVFMGWHRLWPAIDSARLPNARGLALTLNAPSAWLRRSDFVQAMTASGMDEKVIDNLFKKFIKAIRNGASGSTFRFCPEEMKRQIQKRLSQKRIKQLT